MNSETCINTPPVAVDQKEVETLFWRFRSLDRGRKGFVTGDELLAIPGVLCVSCLVVEHLLCLILVHERPITVK